MNKNLVFKGNFQERESDFLYLNIKYPQKPYVQICHGYRSTLGSY